MPTRFPVRTVTPLALLLLVLGPATAAAQPTPPAEAAQPAQPTPPEPPQPPAPPAEPAAPAQPPPPAKEAAPAEEGKSLEDRVKNLEGQMEGVTEPMPAMQADVAGLKRLKFSGYIQGRYEWHDDADYGLDTSKRPPQRGTNRFFVRRGRLKATYTGTLSEYLLQIDANSDGIVLKDAEASFVINNENPHFPSSTEWELKLTLGQFKAPFGFEVLQSSGDREFGERSAVIQALFPGERDRGFRLQYTYEHLRLQAAVINGNFTTDADHLGYDQSSWKDIVGRAGADFEHIVFGVSGHVGRFLRLAKPASMMMPIPGYERYSRLRLGGDVQIFYDIEGVGGLTLRGEAIYARDEQLEFAGAAPDANGCLDSTRYGWIATLVQNFGDYLGAAVRVDQYDPRADLSDTCAMTATAAATAARIDRTTTVGVALLGYISGNLKATVSYEHIGEQGANKKDNDLVRVQMQARF